LQIFPHQITLALDIQCPIFIVRRGLCLVPHTMDEPRHPRVSGL
jgi:hypothetical protein